MVKNAIVFGATSGIGKSLTERLVNDGYRVLITGRRLERLEQIRQQFPDAVEVRKHDVCDLKDTDRLFEELGAVFNHMDLIIHSSGIAEENFDLSWDKDLPTIETNVLGATKIYQCAYNYFKVQGYGHLVGITSVASLVGNRHVPAYHASKSYQSSYLESLWMKARRTRKAKITITNILPGYVDTDIIIGDTFWMSPLEKAVDQMYRAIKKKRRYVFITKRWKLIGLLLHWLPPRIIIKFF